MNFKLFLEGVQNLPPDFRKEFTVDNMKEMRDLAKKHDLVLRTGSCTPVKRDKKYIGYTYHFNTIDFAAGKKSSKANMDKAIKEFWSDFLTHFRERYDISSPITSGAPDQLITSADHLSDNAYDSGKVRLLYKGSARTDPKHAAEMEKHLDHLLSYVLRAKFDGTHRTPEQNEDFIKDQIKYIRTTLDREKKNGFTYPEFEKKLNPKNWKDEFRKYQLANHQKNLKYINLHPTAVPILKAVISDLEKDERKHGFTHPELDKDFPKDSRPLIYWQHVLHTKTPTKESVMKHLLQTLKDSHPSNYPHIIDEISMARKAGLDMPEFEAIEKSMSSK